ncbi:restriction endonuclease subunit S [Morganella morganii]|uniref:restriction endonuclease subunit S n=1 Tax=Morganella morganii TaxID=582 RepID=UPI001BDA1D5B|nr:restriction endonuclease subunit S [Morganella morganii]MBT0329431.1 restriction endonuclease subunit S [Morganella morganii subsp. morganii]HDS6457991.1 restriction endonuclease subunit S [Morganella morganii subsp. morganii]HEG4392917.1 restriction endonuclease subunit S [Morganella morganii]
MSKMGFMEKLLDGVEIAWKPLGELAEIYGGLNGKSKSDFEDGNAKFVTYKNIFANIDVDFNSLESVKVSDAENQHKVKYGDVLFTGSSETAEEAGMSSSVTIQPEEPVYLNSFSFGVRFNENAMLTPEFSKYLFRSRFMRSEIAKTASGVTRFNISKERFRKILVPIFCPENPQKSLEIQREIVRILDTFTSLTAELTAELTARKKQYNYYREQLLRFEEGEVEWKTLGEVTKKWYSGGTPTAGTPEYYENGEIPWLRTQEVKFSDIEETEVKITPSALKNSAAKWIPENCVIIAISGATAGRSAVNKIPLTTNQHCGCLEIDSTKALYRYVFHWVSFNYENIKALGQGARGDLNSSIIRNFKLPIPHADSPEKSLAEQARIVAILDKFDALTSSISEGLPREITLRQKQYEYYRDLLLSFPKSEEVVA